MNVRRIPIRDDRWIYELILDELVPLSSSAASGNVPTFKEIRKRLNRGETYVIRSQNRRGIGFVHLDTVKSLYWIDMLAIKNNEQGNGYGSSLIKMVIRKCRRNRISRLHVLVDRVNTRAIDFYMKHGFEMDGYEQVIDCYRMKRKILVRPLLRK